MLEQGSMDGIIETEAGPRTCITAHIHLICNDRAKARDVEHKHAKIHICTHIFDGIRKKKAPRFISLYGGVAEKSGTITPSTFFFGNRCTYNGQDSTHRLLLSLLPLPQRSAPASDLGPYLS